MKLGQRLSGTCLLDPAGLPAAVAPGLAVLVFQPKTAVSLVVALAATVTTAAGLAVAAGRLRPRPRRPLARGPGVRAVPDPGPPGRLDVHRSGPAAARTVPAGPGPAAGITTIAAGCPDGALDLLSGLGGEAPEVLAGHLLPAGADEDLSRALGNLPEATRAAAVREATAAVAGFMDVNLTGALVAGWRRHDDLTAAAQRTVAAPGRIELVDVARHRITMTQHPSVMVVVDGRQVATIRLRLSVVLRVGAMTAGISGGRLVALRSGRCEATASLAVQGINVLTRQAHLMLPGVIPLSRESGCWPPAAARSAAAPQRRYRAGPMSSIELSAAALPRDDGGVCSRAMASADVMSRVSTRCATAPLTPAAEKDVPFHVAYPPAL